MIEIDENMQIAALSSIAYCAVGEDAALLDMRTNIYYTLNGVGSYIWKAIQKPTTLANICASIESQFNTNGREINADVLALIQEFIGLDFVKVCRESELA